MNVRWGTLTTFLETEKVICGQPLGFSGPVSCFLVLRKSDIFLLGLTSRDLKPSHLNGYQCSCSLFFQGLPCA